MLDLISLIADLVYIALLAAGIYYSRSSATVSSLYTALALYLLALLVQSTSLAADFLDTDEDGWWPVGMSVFSVVICMVITWFIAKRVTRMEAGR